MDTPSESARRAAADAVHAAGRDLGVWVLRATKLGCYAIVGACLAVSVFEWNLGILLVALGASVPAMLAWLVLWLTPYVWSVYLRELALHLSSLLIYSASIAGFAGQSTELAYLGGTAGLRSAGQTLLHACLVQGACGIVGSVVFVLFFFGTLLPALWLAGFLLLLTTGLPIAGGVLGRRLGAAIDPLHQTIAGVVQGHAAAGRAARRPKPRAHVQNVARSAMLRLRNAGIVFFSVAASIAVTGGIGVWSLSVEVLGTPLTEIPWRSLAAGLALTLPGLVCGALGTLALFVSRTVQTLYLRCAELDSATKGRMPYGARLPYQQVRAAGWIFAVLLVGSAVVAGVSVSAAPLLLEIGKSWAQRSVTAGLGLALCSLMVYVAFLFARFAVEFTRALQEIGHCLEEAINTLEQRGSNEPGEQTSKG